MWLTLIIEPADGLELLRTENGQLLHACGDPQAQALASHVYTHLCLCCGQPADPGLLGIRREGETSSPVA